MSTLLDVARAFEEATTAGLHGTDMGEISIALEHLETAEQALRAEWDARKSAYLELDGQAHAIGDRKLTIHTGGEMTCVAILKGQEAPDGPTVEAMRDEVWTSDGLGARLNAWCSCANGEHVPHVPHDVFWCQTKSGFHGWLCGHCRRVTQTG